MSCMQWTQWSGFNHVKCDLLLPIINFIITYVPYILLLILYEILRLLWLLLLINNCWSNWISSYSVRTGFLASFWNRKLITVVRCERGVEVVWTLAHWCMVPASIASHRIAQHSTAHVQHTNTQIVEIIKLNS